MTFAGGRPETLGEGGMPGPCMFGGGAYIAPVGAYGMSCAP